MKTILYYSTGADLLSPSRIAGITRFARTRGWNVVSRSAYKLPLAELVDFWKPIGCVLDNGNGSFDEPLPEGIPHVWLSRDPALLGPDEYLVDQDSVETGRHAASELIRAGAKSYAYIGFHEHQYWSDQRRSGFVEQLRHLGQPEPALIDPLPSEHDRSAVLSELISSLPKPCGLFCATDGVAEEAIGICRTLGVEVPRDAAVIGVDDYAIVCENAGVTQSSVNPDVERGGYMAAELLAALIDGQRPSEQVVWHPPRGVVRRQSTQRFVRFDPRVSLGMEFIRVAIESGISVQRVADSMGCSRRLAEKLFRETTGDTILSAINDALFERAGRMLVENRIPVSAVSDILQISPSALRHIFVERTGLNPLKWAKAQNGNEVKGK